MATYSRLLLSTGGGIISSGQQAEQMKNTASILIGLGGTGVHCIRTIKTQVYDRLKPDVPGSAVPVYSHIRFLGVDSAEASRRGALTQTPNDRSNQANVIMPLSESEFFNIGNNQLARAFQTPRALEHRRDLTWLEYETIKLPDLADAGAGGIRQIGRFMLMDKSSEFLSRLEREIDLAKTGLDTPRVNIHIFSGLSGGTGSGCFLDVCYMARYIANRIGGTTIFGYFFLPDVNLCPIPHENRNVRDYIRKNGYASMQELDYCMNMQYNGGAFTQVYKSNVTIPWAAAPVDMCHLVCATDQNNNAIDHAYDYAMNVTAEYLMDFLTDSTTTFDLQQHLSNFRSMINEANAKKETGSIMDYCIIGASCASVPLREINTYLASRLFEQFAGISNIYPSEADVMNLALSSLAPGAHSLDDIYEMLFQEVQKVQDGASTDYEPYPDGWTFVRDYGNHDLIQHYTNQTAAKIAQFTTNASYMMDDKALNSLIGRVRATLSQVITRLDQGPMFAYRMISAAEKQNLINVVDGLIALNNERMNQASANTELRRTDFENARQEFEDHAHSFFGNARKRFQSYEFYLCVHQQHQLEMETYHDLDVILRRFRDQISEACSGYYIRLSRVMETLINTFEENRQALSGDYLRKSTGGFSIPMMEISEMKKPLDEEIERVNIPGMMDAFVSLLVKNEEDWITEDESRIAKLVTDFFLQTAFNDFANRTITRFLRDKYQEREHRRIEDEELTNFIYEDWMRPLTDRARPLFYFNNSIWAESETAKLAFLSYPESSSPIKAAAQKVHDHNRLWGLKNSALTDRIFIMSSSCGLPLSAYNNCPEYEQMFFSATSVGRHLYEGKSVEGMNYSDWRKLPSVMPQSVLDVSGRGLPLEMKERLMAARKLYQKSRELGVLNSESRFFAPDERTVHHINTLCEDCQNALEQARRTGDTSRLPSMLEELDRYTEIPLVPTEYAMPLDGDRSREDVILRVQEDHFVSAPVLQELASQSLEICMQLHSKMDETRSALQRELQEAKMEADRKRARANEAATRQQQYAEDKNRFFDALRYGVLEVQGNVISFREFDFADPVILSQAGEAYPFASIPPYQAFLNYRNMAPDQKDAVQREYEDRYNSADANQYALSMRDYVTANNLRIWYETAGSRYPGDAQEIKQFLTDFARSFRDFHTSGK